MAVSPKAVKTFDLVVHELDPETGKVVRENAYKRYVRNGFVAYERPKNSKQFFYENGDPVSDADLVAYGFKAAPVVPEQGLGQLGVVASASLSSQEAAADPAAALESAPIPARARLGRPPGRPAAAS